MFTIAYYLLVTDIGLPHFPIHTEKNTIQVLTDQQLLIELNKIAYDLMKLWGNSK